MMEKVHRKLGTAGFVLSLIALVAALGGGAYAASGGLTGKQKKEVTKIAQTEAKKFAGKQGPAGPTGSSGAAGAKGDAGAAGAAGKDGAPGSTGKEGPRGPEGSPWTAGGVIPSGTLVTGTWSSTAAGEYGNSPVANISFPIRAKEGKEHAAYAFTHLEVVGEKFGKEEVIPGFFVGCKVEAGAPNCIDTGCKGDGTAPTAPAGTLCIYATYEETNAPPEDLVASATGETTRTDSFGPSGTAIVPVSGGFSAESHYNAYGTWALSAP